MRGDRPKNLDVLLKCELRASSLADTRNLVQPNDVWRHQADQRCHDRVLCRLGDRQVKQEVFLNGGASCLNFGAEGLERVLDVGDGVLRRPLRGKLCRMHLEDAPCFCERLDVVAIEIE